MNVPAPDSRGEVLHLVDRHPTVSPERLIAQLVPPPTFTDVSFANYRPAPDEPTQAAAVEACQKFCVDSLSRRAGKKKLFGKRETLPGVGLYLDGGFGVGKTHLLASIYHQLPSAREDSLESAGGPPKKAFATFGELTQLAGVFGFVECIELLADYVVVCIDEFELDDPGNTTLISRLLSQLVERGVSIAATSNTLPEQLGEGRFAAQDFLREINTLASIFRTVRIEGPDYRHRGLPPAPDPSPDEKVITRAQQTPGATLDDFDAMCAHLATMHPSRYLTLIEGVTAVFLTGVHPIDDQNVALRLVALTDRLYDAGVPVVASGAPLDTIFSDEMLAGGYRKKYLRATSRLVALTRIDETRIGETTGGPGA
jgi:cell division protein ZapE